MSCRSKKFARHGYRGKSGRKQSGGLGLKKRGDGSMMRKFLFGMLLGLVIGLLFAPKPGPETIDRLAEKRGKLMDKLIRKMPV